MLDPISWRPIEVANSIARWWASAVGRRLSTALRGRITGTQFGMQAGHAPEDVLYIMHALFTQAEISTEESPFAREHQLKPRSQLSPWLDFRRLFNRLPPIAVELTMQRKGFSPRMICVVMGMMRMRTIRVRTAYRLTDPSVPGVGGTQGCRVTCDLSCLVLDAFMATVESVIAG